MGIPDLNVCCFGLSLETGGIIIGWLHLMCSIIGVILGVGMIQFPSPLFDIFLLPQHFGIALFVLCASGVIISIMLINGISTENAKNVNTWVIITTYSYIMYMVIHFVQILHLAIIGQPIKAIGFFFYHCSFTVIVVYFICVVQNLSKKMDSEKYSTLRA